MEKIIETLVNQIPLFIMMLSNGTNIYVLFPLFLVPLISLGIKHMNYLVKFFFREKIPSNYVTYRAGNSDNTTNYDVDFVSELSLFLNFFHPKSIKTGIFSRYQKDEFDPIMFFTCYKAIVSPDNSYFCKFSFDKKIENKTILEKIKDIGFILPQKISTEKLLAHPIYISVDETTEKIENSRGISKNISKKNAIISTIDIEIAQFFVALVINLNIYNRMSVNNFKLEKYVYFYDEKDDDYNSISSCVNVIKKYDNVFLSKDNEKKVIETVNIWTKDKHHHLQIGIPNKLGFLLVGSPGCGKTSLIYAIANETKKHIISFNLQDFTNRTFISAMSRIENSIIVFDDIDAHQFTHKRSLQKSVPIVNDNNNATSANLFKKKITLDTMLEVLDGYNYLNNCIIVMTSNDPEILDDALVRPGRIDHVIKFDLCDEYQFNNMFKYYVGEKYKDINKNFIFIENKYSTSYLINTIILPNKNNPKKILELI